MRLHHPPFRRIPCFKRLLVDLAKAGVIDLLRWVSEVMRSALDSTREIKSPTVLQQSPYSHGMNRRAILTKRSTLFQSGSFFLAHVCCEREVPVATCAARSPSFPAICLLLSLFLSERSSVGAARISQRKAPREHSDRVSARHLAARSRHSPIG